MIADLLLLTRAELNDLARSAGIDQPRWFDHIELAGVVASKLWEA